MARLQRGRHSVAPTVSITDIRPLTRADISHLTVKREPKTLQTLRDNHHRIARAVASGLSNADVAATCGVSIGRVNTLRQDPSFQELVAHKRAMIDAEWATTADPVVDFMRSNAMKAQALLSDKLDVIAERAQKASDDGELDPALYGPFSDLVKVSELGLDRTGYGKVNKNVNINVDFAAKLEEARTRSARAPAARTIEGQAQPVPRLQSGEGQQPDAPQRLVSKAPPSSLRRF